MMRRWDERVPYRERGLCEAENSRRRLQVAESGLRRRQEHGPRARTPRTDEGVVQRGKLDGVAKRGTGAMSLQEPDG